MESTENNSATETDVGDGNLSELLDSCLDDFNKPLPKVASTTIPPKKSNSPSVPTSAATESPDSAAAWSAEFKEFSNVMENFMGDEEFSDIRKLMEGCLSQEVSPNDEEKLTQSFTDTIRKLTEQAQNIPEPSPEDLANLLSGLDMGDTNPSDIENMPELMPLMQDVMQKLMSKELLYPSIKEIVDKYPAWLSEKQSSMETSEFEKYTHQFNLMKQICDEFERECDESEAAKKQQFEKVLQLMQKIQTYGNPPKELVSNISPGVPLDEQGNLQIPGMPQNCVIM